MKKKLVCSQCKSFDDVMTPDEIRHILSESEEILRYYEKGKFSDIKCGETMCWNCVYHNLESFLIDEIDFKEQTEIRKKYNETWAPDFNGSLHHIMNSAMENLCLDCGNLTTSYPYDELSDEYKKYYRKKLRYVGLRLGDVKRQFYICVSCLEKNKAEEAEKRRKRKGPVTRNVAVDMINYFLNEIIRMNKNDQFKSRILTCIVFGSYLSDKESLNDIDIFVSNDWKKSDETTKDPLKNMIALNDERDKMITIAAGDSDHFQFHTWSTIWGFKAVQNDNFKYKYLYIHPLLTREKAEEFLNDAVKRVKDNPKQLIIE